VDVAVSNDSRDNPLDELRDFLENFQDQYGDTVDVESDVMRDEPRGDDEQDDWDLDFDYRPSEVKDHLDQYVIGQEHAKKQLSNAVCYHYRRAERDQRYAQKKNILMIGNTGVGKTHLVEILSDFLDVPFVKADATKFSGTGYVGKNVSSLVRELVEQSDQNIERAEHGIVFIDEIDKICSSDDNGRDVSGRDVQTNLLKLLESTEVSPYDGSDPTAMMKGMFQGGSMGGDGTVSTHRILFICSGAFPGLEDRIANRLDRGGIGFASDVDSGRNVELLKQCEAEDLMDYGLEAEFVGRLPVRTYLHDLDEEDLYRILVNAKSSVLKQYQRDLSTYDIDVEFTESALREIARRAHEHDIGARGLTTTLERTLFEFMHEFPSREIDSLEIDRETVNQPRKTLYEWMIREELDDRLRSEFSDYETEIELTDDARETLVETAVEQETPPIPLLMEKLSPLHHILKMIDRDSLTIDRPFVVETDEAFDELFKKHYEGERPDTD
jgi:ATP-dependent Clp protease ATP-binding subunit ClpX